MTLLEKAQAVVVRKMNQAFSQEQIDLASAWARGEISTSQVVSAIGAHKGGVYCFLARALAEYVRRQEAAK